MKVLMLCRLYSPHLGGVEKHVGELSKELIRRGYEVVVIAEKHDGSLADKETISGVLVHRIPKQSLDSKSKLWSWTWKNKEVFSKADIVQVHDVFWWYLPLRFFYWNKPVYTTFHGYERVEGPKISAVVIRKFSELLSIGNICIGSWMRRWYHQVPTIVNYGASDSKPSALPQKLSAVFIGRLEADTGVLEYIEGIKQLGGKVSLDIFGDGDLREAIKREIKGHKYIRLLGVTNNPSNEIAKHRFVFSSQYLVMLEAQQVGRQVFSYFGTNLKRDYIMAFPTYKQLVAFQSAELMVTRVHQLQVSPKVERENINNARKWASKQTWKKLADDYERLWQK